MLDEAGEGADGGERPGGSDKGLISRMTSRRGSMEPGTLDGGSRAGVSFGLKVRTCSSSSSFDLKVHTY